MAQVYDEPIVVRLTVPVGPYPVGTEFGFKDVADAIRALGSSAYFEVVRTQDGDPIPPPTPEDLTEAERQALARARAARLIRGGEFDKVVPGPGEVIVGGSDGPVKTVAPALTPGLSPENIDPATMGRWRRAVARVSAGIADAKVLCLGDSTTWGLLGGGTTTGSYPARLAARLNASYLPAALGLAIPWDSTGQGEVDPRWSLGTGWWRNNQGYGFGLTFQVPPPASAPLTFTATVRADTFDIYYVTAASGMATFDVTVNGGEATAVTPPSVVGIARATVTATASDNAVVSIMPRASGQIFIVGIEPSLSTTRKIRVGNAGRSGQETSAFIPSGANQPLGAIRAYAPDVTIIMLGINDARAATPRTTEAYLANIDTILTAAKQSGDVILASVVPSQDSALAAREAAYAAGLRALAFSRGCGYIDVYSRYISYTSANALGMMADSLHPNATGYADIAGAMVAALTQV